uniref:Ribosomal protein L23 n=1 Tax=Monsonia speciosa TaxID=163694 RepID=B7T3T8_9ROSI|nr:ribosomal protein L23 [Monsonia speciosa]ACH47397.1 ribosomal protein L23 [Monsonia speciosa]ADJ66422.1 ribosomal protein L23 [Monsonia speciosa]
MDGIQIAGWTYKRGRLFNQNQYTFNVESGFTKGEVKSSILEFRFFKDAKVIAINSHRLPGKGKMRRGRGRGPIMGHRIHYKRMILTIQPKPGSYLRTPLPLQNTNSSIRSIIRRLQSLEREKKNSSIRFLSLSLSLYLRFLRQSLEIEKKNSSIRPLLQKKRRTKIKQKRKNT